MAERTYPQRIELSDTAEHYLERLAEDLISGSAGLEQLPSSLLSFYTFAYEAGRASQQPEIVRLNAVCDRLYLRAYNKPERVKEIQASRVDEGLAAYEAEFFADAKLNRESAA